VGMIFSDEYVDLNNVVWADGILSEWATLEARMNAMKNPSDLTIAVRTAAEFRIWLRDQVKRILEMYSERDRPQGVDEQELLRALINVWMQKVVLLLY